MQLPEIRGVDAGHDAGASDIVAEAHRRDEVDPFDEGTQRLAHDDHDFLARRGYLGRASGAGVGPGR